VSEAYSVITLSPMRKVIAARMTEAKNTIPHFRICADIEVDALIGLLGELRARNPNVNLSLNDLLIKACATALMDQPGINAQWTEKEIRRYHAADISIVTAVVGGLSTPIIRSAESKSIWEIAREVRELAAKAAKNALKMEEIVGGSFSLSNLGMYGVDQFDAIINPPQCAILAIGAAKQRAVVFPGKGLGISTIVRVTLSLDHRAIDGVAGATFLSALRNRIEQPAHLHPAEASL
jgi:pyruvate dehydrogenase E2 component (dihydrolipoamide acetyltransferase)